MGCRKSNKAPPLFVNSASTSGKLQSTLDKHIKKTAHSQQPTPLAAPASLELFESEPCPIKDEGEAEDPAIAVVVEAEVRVRVEVSASYPSVATGTPLVAPVTVLPKHILAPEEAAIAEGHTAEEDEEVSCRRRGRTG